jgi:hypothetical protein
MFWFAKLDSPVLQLLGISPYLGADLFLVALGLVLLHCNILWTFLYVTLNFIID